MSGPIPHEEISEGQRRFKVKDEAERLKRMRWSELEREAVELELPLETIRGAKKIDALRFAILEKKLSRALGGEG
jgi:hypothetical protein